MIDQNLAGVARVAYETVGLAEFRQDTTAAERYYRDSTDHMSDSALKLGIAQDRLRRALDKGPRALNEQRRALLQVRQAERELAGETARTTTQLQRQDRALDGLGRSRGLSRMRSQVVGLSAAFLSTTGLVYAAKRAIDVASNLEEQTAKTRDVFGSSAPEVERYAKNALGLANDEALDLTSTLGALLRPIGIVGSESAKLSTDLARRGVDLASFYNTDVRSAIEAARSGIVGEAEPLRRYGVRLSEARVQALALQQTGKESVKQLTDEEKVRARIEIIFDDSSIAADNYRKTLGGVANQEREAAANWRDTQAALGQTLLPAYKDLLVQVNKYLGDADNQRQIQERVNRAIETGGELIEGMASGVRILKNGLSPLVDALGGVEKAAQLALILGIAAKARKAALSFGFIAASSAATRTKVVADAAVMGAALDAATRPRVVSVSTVGGGVGRGAGVLGLVGGLPGAAALAIGASYFYNADKRATEKAKWDALTPQQQRNALQAEGLDESDLRHFGWTLKPIVSAGLRSRPDEGTRGPTPGAGRAGGGGAGGPAGDGLTRLQRLELAAAEAANRPGLADDLKAARDLEAYYRQIAANENLKGDELFKARQDLLAAQARTQSVEDQIAADRLAGQKKAAATRKANAEKLARARAAEQRERQRQAAIVARRLEAGPYATTSGGFNAAGVDPAFAQREHARRFKNAGDTPPALTREELAREIRSALVHFHGIKEMAGTNQRPTVVVNQTFPEPTPDRNVEARYARFAFAAAFEG